MSQTTSRTMNTISIRLDEVNAGEFLAHRIAIVAAELAEYQLHLESGETLTRDADTGDTILQSGEVSYIHDKKMDDFTQIVFRPEHSAADNDAEFRKITPA